MVISRQHENKWTEREKTPQLSSRKNHSTGVETRRLSDW